MQLPKIGPLFTSPNTSKAGNGFSHYSVYKIWFSDCQLPFKATTWPFFKSTPTRISWCLWRSSLQPPICLACLLTTRTSRMRWRGSVFRISGNSGQFLEATLLMFYIFALCPMNSEYCFVKHNLPAVCLILLKTCLFSLLGSDSLENPKIFNIIFQTYHHLCITYV